MMSRAEQLAVKRQALQLRCALQRQEVAFLTGAIESKLGNVDRVLDIAGGVVRNPVAVVAGIAGMVMLKPWRLMRWAGQGWLLFNLARKVKAWAAS